MWFLLVTHLPELYIFRKNKAPHCWVNAFLINQFLQSKYIVFTGHIQFKDCAVAFDETNKFNAGGLDASNTG